MDAWVRKIPWSRKWQPATLFLPRESHGQNSLVGYSPEGHKESDTVALISYASKVMLKILQAKLQQYVNRELMMFKLDLEKAEEPEIKLPISAGS